MNFTLDRPHPDCHPWEYPGLTAAEMAKEYVGPYKDMFFWMVVILIFGAVFFGQLLMGS
jgi:hypothetical protein